MRILAVTWEAACHTFRPGVFQGWQQSRQSLWLKGLTQGGPHGPKGKSRGNRTTLKGEKLENDPKQHLTGPVLTPLTVLGLNQHHNLLSYNRLFSFSAFFFLPIDSLQEFWYILNKADVCLDGGTPDQNN